MESDRSLIRFESVSSAFDRLFVFWIIMLVSCSGSRQENVDSTSSSPRIRKQIEVVSPKINAMFTLGQTVPFELHNRDDGTIDSVVVEVGGQVTRTNKSSFQWGSDYQRTGTPRLKMTVYFGAQSEILYPKIRFRSNTPPEKWSYRLVNSYPHDQTSYVQGLFFLGEKLVESTGQKGKSSIRLVNYQTGTVLNNVALEDRFFGEGVTSWNDRIYQLTWQEQTVFCYDTDLKLIETYAYPGAGWGVTTMGDTLLVSDGTENIYYINPRDFTEIDRIQVYDHTGKIDQLNELELIDGLLYANIYGEEVIAVIDPHSGVVQATINFDGLIDRQQYRGMDYAFNGIAHHADGRIFVTAKWYPQLHEVEVIRRSTNP